MQRVEQHDQAERHETGEHDRQRRRRARAQLAVGESEPEVRLRGSPAGLCRGRTAPRRARPARAASRPPARRPAPTRGAAGRSARRAHTRRASRARTRARRPRSPRSSPRRRSPQRSAAAVGARPPRPARPISQATSAQTRNGIAQPRIQHDRAAEPCAESPPPREPVGESRRTAAGAASGRAARAPTPGSRWVPRTSPVVDGGASGP